MSVLNIMQSAGLAGPMNSAGAGQDRLLGVLQDVSQESMDFQAMLVDLQQRYSSFHAEVQSKQEELKSLTDVVRDGIRKSAER